MTPPAPASAAPRQNTVVNSLDTGMPTARAICMSSTPARIIAPIRVHSISACSAIAVTIAMPSTTRRYAGNAILPTTSGRCSDAGAANGIGSPPQIIRQRSATMNEMPSVTSTCPSGLPVSGRRSRRSSNPPHKATAAAASSAAFFAPASPMARVPTGIPPGICAVDKSESSP